MKQLVITLILGFFTVQTNAQSNLKIEENSFQIDNLQEDTFVSFTKQKLENSQFVFVGEQHGIKEAGVFTNALYTLAQPYNYNTLCVETDAIAAQELFKIAASGSPVDEARNVYEQFPFSIPFYNNEDDYELFKNVVSKKGTIWGIDQTFMVQFRMNFDHLMKIISNKKLKSKLKLVKKEAEEAFKKSIETKDFNVNYIFKYDEVIHKELLELATTKEEKEIIEQLWKTKEIYTYNNITKEYYKNNNVRAQLMKRNFMRYYREAQKKESTPKVVFKLGANHASKGLTRTNVYDISNLGSELAISNNLASVHYIVMGITGEASIGHPFAPKPTMSFDNIKQFPKEIQDVIPSISKKYYVLDLVPLRAHGYGKKYTEDFKKVIFGYDILVLVTNAEATRSF